MNKQSYENTQVDRQINERQSCIFGKEIIVSIKPLKNNCVINSQV